MGLHDRTGLFPLRQFAHVKITHPRHVYYGSTGTIVRTDVKKRKVWIALPGGTIVQAGNRSVEVLAPNNARVVK